MIYLFLLYWQFFKAWFYYASSLSFEYPGRLKKTKQKSPFPSQHVESQVCK